MRLWSWHGSDRQHRVKCGRAGELPEPQITGVTQIDGGDFHVVTGKDGGTIVSWGDDSAGQACAPLGVTTTIQVSAGKNHSLALLHNGRVIGWGTNTMGQLTIPPTAVNVVSLTTLVDRQSRWHNCRMGQSTL